MSTVQTPLPGIFYRKPSPDAAEFVQEGDTVAAGQTIGLIEVMKSFTELKADVAGVVSQFLVANEDEVSVGQNIAVVE